MKYRLTCLSPVLVGDGSHLSPIDYMVWRDQVNVLDQTRIFRLLAKGPRLENYLKQIQRADKLEFAAWGGFAQNYAGRRIPFEDPAYSAYWEALPSDQLRIPTFLSSADGPYLSGTALKGALRTALVSSHLTEGAVQELAEKTSPERMPRAMGERLEERLVGSAGVSRLKPFSVGDSAAIGRESLRIFMLRTATLAPGGPGKLALQWKQAPRGAVDGSRPERGSATFAEMAVPGTVFEGRWKENPFYSQPDVVKALRWKSPMTTSALVEAANSGSEKALRIHLRYAEVAGLAGVRQHLEELLERLSQVREDGRSCILCLGWGGGFLSKSSVLDTSSGPFRQILELLPYYSRAIRSGLPFPKTRRVVFLKNRPAALPGWCLLEIGDENPASN